MKWSDFQTGDYPIKQVIFIGFDSVMGPLLTGILERKYGTIDIAHSIRQVNKPMSSAWSKLDVLSKTTKPVVTVCWSEDALKAIIPEYEAYRGWPNGSVRIYSLGGRIL